jgi:hypothetical protein
MSWCSISAASRSARTSSSFVVIDSTKALYAMRVPIPPNHPCALSAADCMNTTQNDQGGVGLQRALGVRGTLPCGRSDRRTSRYPVSSSNTPHNLLGGLSSGRPRHLHRRSCGCAVGHVELLVVPATAGPASGEDSSTRRTGRATSCSQRRAGWEARIRVGWRRRTASRHLNRSAAIDQLSPRRVRRRPRQQGVVRYVGVGVGRSGRPRTSPPRRTTGGLVEDPGRQGLSYKRGGSAGSVPHGGEAGQPPGWRHQSNWTGHDDDSRDRAERVRDEQGADASPNTHCVLTTDSAHGRRPGRWAGSPPEAVRGLGPCHRRRTAFRALHRSAGIPERRRRYSTCVCGPAAGCSASATRPR